MSNIWSRLINLAGNITGVLPLANGGTNASTKAGAFDSLSPMTTAGDVIYGGTAGTGTRLGIGAATTVLHGGASAPSWSQIVNADVDAAAAIAGSKIVTATGSVSGVVDTNAQTFAGAKTFTNGIALGAGTDILITYVVGSTASTFTWNGTGSPGTSASITLRVTRVGDWVTLYLPSTTATTGTTSTTLTSNTALGTSFRPATLSQYAVVPILNNGGVNPATPGLLRVTTGGLVSIFKDSSLSGAFTNTSVSGTDQSFTFTYYVGTGS